MKRTLALMVVLFSSTLAMAAVQFKVDSIIPADVQAEIVTRIDQQCVQIREMNWAIEELRTEMQIDQVDQGLTDTYYTSVLEVDAKEMDSNHSRRFLLIVKAMKTEANNGTHLSAEILEGCY